MAFKFVIFACALAVANAGGLISAPAVAYSAAPAVSHVSYASPVVSYGAPSVQVASHALTSQDSNIHRSFGNLGQVATQSKTITTPYSQVTRSDVRVSNPGLTTYAAAAPVAYAHAPVAAYAAAPALRYAAAPAPLAVAHAAPAAYAHAAPAGLLGVAYSPATAVSHMTYSAPAIGLSYGCVYSHIVYIGIDPILESNRAPGLCDDHKQIARPVFVIFACALAAANAGLISAPAVAYSAAPAVSHVSYASPVVSYGAPSVQIASHALTSQDSNIHRSFGNLGQVATQSKTITTPYSQVTKSDVRVSNPGYQTLSYGAAAPVAYAHAPVAAYAAAPALRYAAAPAPLAVAHAPAAYAHAAPAAYAHAAPAGLLGVAYSPATAVSHMTYSAPAIGLSYGCPYNSVHILLRGRIYLFSHNNYYLEICIRCLFEYINNPKFCNQHQFNSDQITKINKKNQKTSTMAFKFVIFACALAVANAGGLISAPAVAYSAAPAVSHVSYASPVVSYGAPSVQVASPSITSQDSNIVRSFGNLGQVATQSKTITTPYSQVTKSDVRVSNPGLTTYTAAAPVAYGAIAHGPVAAYAAAPALRYAAAPALAAPALRYAAAPAPVAYAHGPVAAYAAAPALAAPALRYAAPAAYAAAPALAAPALRYAAPAPLAVAHAAPAVRAVAAPGAALLGVAYSPATAVSHMTYSAPAIGLSYGW
ncbi:uncharacterized protein LOC123300309 [Chrysoperla carnea]|uniref:uncharacterized protein LOC123300309 n=1 Tax=Chrysoperla carnea TaxID=189513 RepID=UPI001D076F73|nr:uncharacterized protein LOC123300309 [Chrysoperla carnea]